MNSHGKRFGNSARKNKEHAVVRAKERYSLQLSNRKRKMIAHLIEEGHGRFIKNGSLVQRKVYGIYFEDKHLWVVYDHYTNRIVTFLPNHNE